MKNFSFLLMLIATVAATSCKKGNSGTEKKALTNQELIGQWKATANFVSTGGPGVWNDVPNNQNLYVEFKADGTLAGNSLANTYGTFFIKNDSTITLIEKNSPTIQNYKCVIEGNTLTLSPAGPIFCVEGCATRYAKQ